VGSERRDDRAADEARGAGHEDPTRRTHRL
jgi:hypothetical protein